MTNEIPTQRLFSGLEVSMGLKGPWDIPVRIYLRYYGDDSNTILICMIHVYKLGVMS